MSTNSGGFDFEWTYFNFSMVGRWEGRGDRAVKRRRERAVKEGVKGKDWGMMRYTYEMYKIRI